MEGIVQRNQTTRPPAVLLQNSRNGGRKDRESKGYDCCAAATANLPNGPRLAGLKLDLCHLFASLSFGVRGDATSWSGATILVTIGFGLGAEVISKDCDLACGPLSSVTVRGDWLE